MDAAPSTGKKMDRRTAYTRMTVKDALLELLEEQSFEKITVAALCRQAEITRATLSHYVIRRIYMVERDNMVPYLMKHCRLSHSEADKLFMMIVYGLFYVNRSMKWMKDESWYEMQMTLNRFFVWGI